MQLNAAAVHTPTCAWLGPVGICERPKGPTTQHPASRKKERTCGRKQREFFDKKQMPMLRPSAAANNNQSSWRGLISVARRGECLCCVHVCQHSRWPLKRSVQCSGRLSNVFEARVAHVAVHHVAGARGGQQRPGPGWRCSIASAKSTAKRSKAAEQLHDVNGARHARAP